MYCYVSFSLVFKRSVPKYTKYTDTLQTELSPSEKPVFRLKNMYTCTKDIDMLTWSFINEMPMLLGHKTYGKFICFLER